MKSTRSVLFHALLTHIFLFILIPTGKCNDSFLAESSRKQIELNNQYYQYAVPLNILPACELVYQDYLKAIENFTHCEIHHVTPFRLCLKCLKHYQVMANLFAELNDNPHHKECKQKYMMSDIVQIIPTVQKNMDKMWRTSHCRRCYTKNDTMRARVIQFLTLYDSFNVCINASIGVERWLIKYCQLTAFNGYYGNQDKQLPYLILGNGQKPYCVEEMKNAWSHDENKGNNTDPCIRCKSQYTALNANFNAMYSADAGDVCMDIMDMMNYTRIKWSSQFNCTASSYDSTPVIVISCIVACTPIVFYVYLRITGKVQGSKLFKPKRLTTGAEISSGSHSTANSSQNSR